MTAHDDATWMRRAVALGARGTRDVRPNPRVGCVIVQDGQEIASGWHAKVGGPHAEVVALAQLAGRADGATAYVTLEPCAHFGRTPPCAQALVDAGISRVVVGALDPNPQAAGGVAALRAVGVDVVTGVEEDACRALAEVFLTRIELGRPLVHAKLAMTLDGRIAAKDGTSRWISGPAARRCVHEWRAEAEAVLTGSGTAQVDDPTLDVRDVDDPTAARQPLRVVLDRRLRLDPECRLADTARQRTLVFVEDPSLLATDCARALLDRGVELACVSAAADATAGSGAGSWLTEVLRNLAARGVHHVLAETGPTLTSALLRQDLVDRLDLFIAPKLLGAGVPVVGDLGITSLNQALLWRLDGSERLGDDVHLTLRPRRAVSFADGNGPAGPVQRL